MSQNNLLVLSANCQGLRDKKVDVLNYLSDKNPHILWLQNTHKMTKNLLKGSEVVNVSLIEIETIQEMLQLS